MDNVTLGWPTALVRWIPGGMVAGGVVFDLATPEPYTGDPLFAGGCVLAGATQATRATMITFGAALLAMLALTMEDNRLYDHRGIADLSSVVLAGVIAVAVNRILRRHGRRLATVRGVAEAAQRALLPDPPQRLGPLGIAARYEAAASEARIGGDVYAAQATPYGIRLLIGDVRGKGLGAVGAVGVLLGAFREAADAEPDLPRLADRLDRALDRHQSGSGGETQLEGFTTGLLAEFSADGGTLHLVNRGHPPPYLLTADGSVRTLEPSAPDLPFGMHGLGGVRSVPDTVDVPHGATLLLVTDGVTETRDAAGDFYEPQARLPALGPQAGPQQAVEALLRDLDTWTGGRPGNDDRAVLAVRRD
ncbi:PP2C family protein-serine/threonine phosphatase [Actinacidiphila bryophytorum]|nr:PP2C family protein-serine/threonine phosphatase [Actinacidiphila bryophytorum]MBM9439958.1 serine/threonine-protein phosphatase [Actinacidiphila bryophytorum]MBN6544628.1 serine/threonine-protein phosphatase [Actinacidiphila bryophytorum]